MPAPRRLVAVLLPALVALAACGGTSSTPASSGAAPGVSPGSSPSTSTSRPTGTVTVFAAASLSGTFTTIAERFEAANPGSDVVLNFGPSSGLATQITQGAPADVYASASPRTMRTVIEAGFTTTSYDIAANELRIAVPPANPARITRLADLARDGVKVALCQAQVPCGTVAAQVLEKAEVRVTPVTLEADVKATLTKVQLGEVDAGLVYVTDVLAAGSKVRGVTIPPGQNASTLYQIATRDEAPNPALAKAFVDAVLSAEGQRVLQQAGFTPLVPYGP